MGHVNTIFNQVLAKVNCLQVRGIQVRQILRYVVELYMMPAAQALSKDSLRDLGASIVDLLNLILNNMHKFKLDDTTQMMLPLKH